MMLASGATDILTDTVYFFDKGAQPGGADLMWTVQLDVDVNWKAHDSAPTPAASEPANAGAVAHN